MEKVSVVIPAYNKAALTVETVESALNQTYKNIEIIIVDDGSTDNTKELLFSYRDRIIYIYKENGGACSARNIGIESCSGEFVALLDCDDLYLPQKLEVCLRYLKKHPEFGFVYTRAYFIDGNNKVLREYPNPKIPRSGWIAKNLLLRNFIPNSTVVIRKECFDKVGLFNESIFTPADWNMWIRLAEKYPAGYIDSCLTKYRVSDGYILKHLKQAEKEEYFVLEEAFKRNPGISSYFKCKAESNVYLSSALNFIITGSFSYAKVRLSRALFKNVFNIKAWLVFICLIFNKQALRKKVIKKIFCKDIFIEPGLEKHK